jgi:hypothetical protein
MTPVTQIPYLRLREARALKLSLGPHGIGYVVLADPARSRLFIIVVANEGGGNWNKEVVAFPDIEEVLASAAQGESFTAKIFRTVFAGKSSNNSGFLAAALVHEGLIAPAADAKHKLVRSGDWSRWKAELLALDGEAILIPPVLPEAAVATPALPDVQESGEEIDAADTSVAPTRKNARAKNRLITVQSPPSASDGGIPGEGESNASHQG